MPTLIPVDHDPFGTDNSGDSGLTLQPVDHDPFALAPQGALANQVSSFPQRAANLAISALGPLGDAGMMVGDALRTGNLDTRDIPQIAGGVMLGAGMPGEEEAAPAEEAIETAAQFMPSAERLEKMEGNWRVPSGLSAEEMESQAAGPENYQEEDAAKHEKQMEALNDTHLDMDNVALQMQRHLDALAVLKKQFQGHLNKAQNLHEKVGDLANEYGLEYEPWEHSVEGGTADDFLSEIDNTLGDARQSLKGYLK